MGSYHTQGVGAGRKRDAEEILKENFKATPSFAACKFCSYQSICDAKIIDE